MKLTLNIKTGVLAVLIMGACACKKNYLDRKPSDLITEEEVFKNIENAEKFVNTIYQGLPNMFQPGAAWQLGSATDETNQGIDNSASGADAGNFNTGSMSPSNFPMQGQWNDYYSRIRSCNIFLSNFPKVPNDPTYPERRSRLKGEALLLRAYYYFQLLSRWGEVPLLEEVQNPFDNPDGIYYKRNTISEVVEGIVKDLDEARELLPSSYAERPNNWGRASRTIALALRGRVLLYYASPLYNKDKRVVLLKCQGVFDL